MGKLIRLVSISLLLVLLLIPADTEVAWANPDTLTIQPSAKDTFVYAATPGTSYGTQARLNVQDHKTTTVDYRMRAFLEFDISAIPAGQAITSATLQLYYYEYLDTDPVGKIIWAYKLTRTDWVENSGGGATWNSYNKTGSAWTTPGGDYDTNYGGSTTFPASYGWMSWDALSIVQDAYDNSNPAEFAVRFATENLTSGYGTARFYSKEYTDTSLRPKLVVTYAPALQVTAVGLYETNHTNAVTNMDPQTEYAIKVSVTDYDKLSDLSTVKATLYYDSDGTYNAGEVPTSGNTTTCAILTCTVVATPGWSIDPSADTSWELVDGNCVQPDLDGTSGDFWFHFKPGKVATETVAPAKWHIHAAAVGGTTGTGYQANREMNWYGEISTPSPSSVAWGTVTPGTDFGDSTKKGPISITYIANGNYDQKVKTTGTWTGAPSSTATLDPSGNCTNANQFALKADDAVTIDNAVLVTTSGVSIDNTGTQTGESGNPQTLNTLWLKLASGFSKATYSGTITYTIADR